MSLFKGRAATMGGSVPPTAERGSELCHPVPRFCCEPRANPTRTHGRPSRRPSGAASRGGDAEEEAEARLQPGILKTGTHRGAKSFCAHRGRRKVFLSPWCLFLPTHLRPCPLIPPAAELPLRASAESFRCVRVTRGELSSAPLADQRVPHIGRLSSCRCPSGKALLLPLRAYGFLAEHLRSP